MLWYSEFDILDKAILSGWLPQPHLKHWRSDDDKYYIEYSHITYHRARQAAVVVQRTLHPKNWDLDCSEYWLIRILNHRIQLIEVDVKTIQAVQKLVWGHDSRVLIDVILGKMSLSDVRKLAMAREAMRRIAS